MTFFFIKRETLPEVIVLSGDHLILKICLKGQVHNSSSNRNAVEVKKSFCGLGVHAVALEQSSKCLY